MTSLAEEQAEQRRWKLRPEYARMDVFDRLVASEFAPPERVEAEDARALGGVVRFAAERVPYYRDLFGRLGLTARDIADRRDLPRIPLLTKRDVREHVEALRPDALPPGVAVWGPASSSGSTGSPIEVVHSVVSNAMFTILTQRHYRWFRRDPGRVMASIRSAQATPRPTPETLLAPGETLRAPRWRYVGVFFETGPGLYFNILTPVEAQIAWLRRERPDYLLLTAHALEHLAMACAGERPCDSLRAVSPISEAITPATRRHLEAIYGARMDQAYGLNEIGIVAAQCEADRYHVHREHCVVEIVDEAGRPVRPGRAGRILVTGLQNLAMPLLRYDTDDLATATDGPCPCGRTLPSFGEIRGRYSRIVGLPDGTLDRVAGLRTALHSMPPDLARPLRRYQIHQRRDGSFELRLVCASEIAATFLDRVQRAWSALVGAAGPPLRVRTVPDIPYKTAGNKFEDFTSDFMADRAVGADAAPR